MSLAELPHIHLSYAEQGSPEGIPVLLLHGFPDSAASWRALIDGWQGEPVRWIVPDLRGFGSTRITDPASESGQLAAHVEDAVALLDALGIDRAIWMGHDWGAGTLFAAAVLHPGRFRAAIGLGSTYVRYGTSSGELPHVQERAFWYQWFFHTPQGEQSLTRDRVGLCRLLWETWSPTWRFSEADFAEAAKTWENPQFVATVLSYYRTRHGNDPGAARYAAEHTVIAGKPAIAVPTWFISGTADGCELPEGPLGQEPWFTGGYKHVLLDGVGHYVQREAPERVAAVLRTVLTETR